MKNKNINYSLKKINSYKEFVKYISPLEKELFNENQRPESVLNRRLVKCMYLFDEDKNIPIGYSLIQYFKQKDKIIKSKLAISKFGISREYQKMGFGDILLKASIEWVKKYTDYKVLYIGVEKKNEIAQKLYKKNGFKPNREVSHSYLLKLEL